MIGLLIRLALGKNVGGFWLGLAFFLVGIALSGASLFAVVTVGTGTSVVFVGLIVGGLIRMVLSAPMLLSSFGRGAHDMSDGGSSAAALPNYFAPPAEMPPGYCWQCGGKVKQGYAICLNCGASQAGAEQEVSEASRLSGFDATSAGVPRYSGRIVVPTPWQQQQQPDPYQQMGPDPYQQMGPGPYPQGGPNPYQQQPNPYQQMGPGPYPQGGPGPYPQGGPDPYLQMGPGPYPQGGPPPGQQRGGRSVPRRGRSMPQPDPYQQADERNQGAAPGDRQGGRAAPRRGRSLRDWR